MSRPFLYVRCAVFFFLVVCFAVQASVAAWDIQNERFFHLHTQLDAFLIFCGAFGLVLIFPIAYIDLLRRNALFVRVWFEAMWLGVFFILEIAGAAAITVIVPGLDCDGDNAISCQSASVLTGFTWTITVVVLIYLSLLIICAILHHDEFPQVWHTGVRDFPWFEKSQQQGHRRDPSWVSPNRQYFFNKASPVSQVAAPKPRNVQPPPVWTSYEIEHFQPPEPTTWERSRHHSRRRSAEPTAPSLYPQYMDSIMGPTIPSTVYSSSELLRPAGSWPNNAASSPQVSREPPTPASRPRPQPQPQSQSRGNRARPPPLDLSKATAYRNQ